MIICYMYNENFIKEVLLCADAMIAVVITLIVTAVLTYFITTAYHKNVANAKIGNAEDRAREIIDEAVKTAETKKREAMLEAKEESIRSQK